MIFFDTIPNGRLVPGAYTETSGRLAASANPSLPRRVMCIGQRLSTGTVAAGTPFRVFSPSDAEAAAGVGSHLSEMLQVVRAAFPSVELWGIGLADDGASVAATATFTFAGTATAAGTFSGYVSPYWVGNAFRGRYRIAVTSGMTAAQAAAAWVAVVNADPYRAVTAAAVGAVVTCTARNAGLLGNGLTGWHSYFSGEAIPAGLTCTITAFSSGATNPAISSAISAMGDMHTTHLIHPFADATNLTAVETEMSRRWGGTVQRECQAFTCQRGSLATLTTFGNTRNSQWQCLFGVGLSPTPTWIAAAGVGAVDAASNHPGIPLLGKPIDCMVAPLNGDEFEADERDQLLAEGISTFLVDPSGKCQLERLVTSYQVDTLGSPDSKYRDRQVMGLLFAIRYDWRTFVSGKYGQYMHAADGSTYAPGLPVVTPSTMKAELDARAKDIWQYGQAWIENAAAFAASISIERTEDGMDMACSPDLINRLHITRTRFDFLR